MDSIFHKLTALENTGDEYAKALQLMLNRSNDRWLICHEAGDAIGKRHWDERWAAICVEIESHVKWCERGGR